MCPTSSTRVTLSFFLAVQELIILLIVEFQYALGLFGVFLFPYLMHSHSLLAAESAAAIASLLGGVVTVFMLPETKGKSLEELSSEQSTPAERTAA